MMLHCTTLSVHSARNGRGGGGGVMEDGGSHAPGSPRQANILSDPHIGQDYSKTQSLPGHYTRAIHPPQSFREAFNTSHVSTSETGQAPAVPPRPEASATSSIKSHMSFMPNLMHFPGQNKQPSEDKKGKKSLLGGFFRRKKKDSSSSDSSSDAEEPTPKRTFFRRRRKKKEPSVPVNSDYQPNKNDVAISSPIVSASQTFSVDTRSMQTSMGIKAAPSQPLGIPFLSKPGMLSRTGFSMSHGSLPSGGIYGAVNSSVHMTGMGIRSSSSDMISRKERREALKARVEKLRDKIKDSSSDDEKGSYSSYSYHGSETSLSKTNSLGRSKSSRTERYMRRKSQELETLKIETEKDKRNREAVQARILEIQKIHQYEAQRNQRNEDKTNNLNLRYRSANVLYKEHSEYDSSAFIRTPSMSPTASPRMQNKYNYNHSLPYYSSNSIHQKPTVNRESINANYISLPYDNSTNHSLKQHSSESFTYGDLRGHRSASYDSNINRTSRISNENTYKVSGLPPVNRTGLTPPPPPPRDSSRIISPNEVHRPMSYSFENIHHGANNQSVNNLNANNKPLKPVSYFPTFNARKITYPPDNLFKLSFQEQNLTSRDQLNTEGVPNRPVLPNFCKSYPNEDQNSISKITKLNTSFSSNADSVVTNEQYIPPKSIPISSIPPSPSSDYSSYVSDNSTRIQQVHASWKPKEYDLMTKTPALQVLNTQITDSSRNTQITDSSRSCSPKVEPSKENSFIYPKRFQPHVTLKPTDSISSLSGQSDVSSPVPKISQEKGIDSDSSQNSLNREKNKSIPNRPLSMVLENMEKDNCKTQPDPPKRNASQTPCSLESTKSQVHEISVDSTSRLDNRYKGKQFKDAYVKEKERLEKNKSADFEDALKELEDLYDSLKLDSEDIIEGAERLDSSMMNQSGMESSLDSSFCYDRPDSVLSEKGRDRVRRSSVPDKVTDDMHFRRCQISSKLPPDPEKAMQKTGSYLLVSPAHTTPIDLSDFPKTAVDESEPDIVYDDVTYRNIQRANSIKIIDPQPPFGIPLGPHTQSSASDYLHVNPNETSETATNDEPDIEKDDLAFRNLRKDLKNKPVNTKELDELLTEVNKINHSKRRVRSMSADRSRTDYDFQQDNLIGRERISRIHTPRQVKQQNEARKTEKFIESLNKNLTDIDGSPLNQNYRNNPSWLERAQLSDNKWDSFSTSTETLTELSSTRAISQPDIRQAIIREAREPTGGPYDFSDIIQSSLPNDSANQESPKLVKVQAVANVPFPVIVEKKRPYKPLDTLFNNKPKPFYIQDNSKKNENPVDIAKLDALISSLSKLESNPDDPPENIRTKNFSCDIDSRMHLESPIHTPLISDPTAESVVIENSDNSDSRIQSPEILNAKENIQKAIRLSMAMESSNSEGNRLTSRRFSAVEMPMQESMYSSISSPTSQTVHLSNKVIPGPSLPERVVVSEAITQTACAASTCTNKIQSMVVRSEFVNSRGRRAKSMPTSPRQSLRLSMLTKELVDSISMYPSNPKSLNKNHSDNSHTSPSTYTPTSPQSSIYGDDSIANITKPYHVNTKSSTLPCMTNKTSKGSDLKSPSIVQNVLFNNITADCSRNTLYISSEKETEQSESNESKPSTPVAPKPPSRSSSLPPVIPYKINPSELSANTKYQKEDRASTRRVTRKSSVASSSSSSDSNESFQSTNVERHQRQHSSSSDSHSEVDYHPCSEGEGGLCDPLFPSDSQSSTIQQLIAGICLIWCVAQLAGMDLLAAFGLILAMASVFITFSA